MASKRLEAMREFTEFGAGFKIAMRDMEIRGAGNLLGAQQQNHISAGHVNLGAPMVFQSVQLFIMPVAVANLNGNASKASVLQLLKNGKPLQLRAGSHINHIVGNLKAVHSSYQAI